MKVTKSCTLKIRGGRDTYVKWDGSQGTAGKGPLVQWERSGTLGVSQDQTLFVWRETEQDLHIRVTDGR
jgi:hypothetical protein